MQIQVREYQEQRPNGDRSCTTSPSSRFDVVLIPDNREVGDVVLSSFDMFDDFHTHVKKREPVEIAAQVYARKVAFALGCPMTTVRMVKKIVQREEWVAETDV